MRAARHPESGPRDHRPRRPLHEPHSESLVRGMPQALKKSKAVKAYLCNLMTKKGETDGFTGEDFVREIEKYLGTGVLDYVIFNSKKPQDGRPRNIKKKARSSCGLPGQTQKEAAGIYCGEPY